MLVFGGVKGKKFDVRSGVFQSMCSAFGGILIQPKNVGEDEFEGSFLIYIFHWVVENPTLVYLLFIMQSSVAGLFF